MNLTTLQNDEKCDIMENYKEKDGIISMLQSYIKIVI